jgi:hypothetical protein
VDARDKHGHDESNIASIDVHSPVFPCISLLRPCYPSLHCPVILGSFCRFPAVFRRFLEIFCPPLQRFTGAVMWTAPRVERVLVPKVRGDDLNIDWVLTLDCRIPLHFTQDEFTVPLQRMQISFKRFQHRVGKFRGLTCVPYMLEHCPL